MGTSASSGVSIGTDGRRLNLYGGVTLGAEALSAYQLSVNSGYINIGCSTIGAGATINIGSASSSGTPYTYLGSVSSSGNSVTSIGNGSGSGNATVSIASGTNSGTNNVSIGNSSTNLTLKGSPYNPPNNYYPPTSTSSTDSCSVNVVTQLYNNSVSTSTLSSLLTTAWNVCSSATGPVRSVLLDSN